MTVMKMLICISFLWLNTLGLPVNMAESLPITDRPTDDESLKFAKALYSFIWPKFNVVHGVEDQLAREPDEYCEHFHLDIGRAVLSEQVFTRSFYKCFLFVSKKSFILKDTTTALIFCKNFCEKTRHWEYFKRLFRFSALIAEFFLYRTLRMQRLQLQRAPLIWNTIFKKYFAETFYAKGGWEGLLQYSQRYADVYSPLEAIIEDMKTPYESVSVDYAKSMPRHLIVPETDPGNIDKEMSEVFRYFQSYFASKLKPVTPVEKHHEMDIPEDSENESTNESVGASSGSSSSLSEKDPSGFRKEMSKLVLEDARKKPRLHRPSEEDFSGIKKSGDSEPKLVRPFQSTSMDKYQDASPSDEDTSKEEQTTDESLPSSSELEYERKDSKKRPQPMDPSDSEDPTVTKLQKLAGSSPSEETSKEEQTIDESIPLSELEYERKDSKKRPQPMDPSGSEDPTMTKLQKLSD